MWFQLQAGWGRVLPTDRGNVEIGSFQPRWVRAPCESPGKGGVLDSAGEAGVAHENVRGCHYLDDIRNLGMDEII